MKTRTIMASTEKLLTPIHPGEILHEEFLRPLALSSNRLAAALDVPANRIADIVRGRRTITADTAVRLARYFGTTPELWMNLQRDYELRLVRRHRLAEIERKIRPRPRFAHA